MAEKKYGSVVMSSRDTPQLIQFVECIFNKMLPIIQCIIKRKCFISVFLCGMQTVIPLFSEIHVTMLRYSLRLPETYCYRGGGAGG